MALLLAAPLLLAATGAAAGVCTDIAGTWHGHPAKTGRIDPQPIVVEQTHGSTNFTALFTAGQVMKDGRSVTWAKDTGALSANTALNASAPGCTRIDWHGLGHRHGHGSCPCESTARPCVPEPRATGVGNKDEAAHH